MLDERAGGTRKHVRDETKKTKSEPRPRQQNRLDARHENLMQNRATATTKPGANTPSRHADRQQVAAFLAKISANTKTRLLTITYAYRG